MNRQIEAIALSPMLMWSIKIFLVTVIALS